MKNKRLFSFITAIVVMFSICTILPMKISVPLKASATYENTHTNTGNQRADIVAIAQTQVEYHEGSLEGTTNGSNNYTKYNVWFGKVPPKEGAEPSYYYMWCQSFIAWCANQADISTNVVPRVSGTVSGMDFFKKNNRWQDRNYTPQSGDIIYFTSSSSNSGYHVGIVESISGSTINTIEGNYSNKVARHSVTVGSASIVGYGVPNYSNLNPPTYSNLTANKTMIAVGEEITFTASSDYATGFSIGVDNKNGRYVTQEMSNGQLTLTFNETGSYGAYVTSYNSAGYVDSNWISFIVYDTTPMSSELLANKYVAKVGEEITFTASSDLASAYWIGIDNKSGRYLTQEMPNGQLTLTFNEAGSYGAYVTSLNSLGYVDSQWINFTIYDSAPTYSILEADKVKVAVGEEITFTASSDLASAYWIGIDNETERYTTQEMYNGKLTLIFDKAGNYGAYVTSLNTLGYVDSKWIEFTVYDKSPTYGKLESEWGQYKFVVGETIPLVAISDLATEYWLGFDKGSERIITEEMQNGKHSVVYHALFQT